MKRALFVWLAAVACVPTGNAPPWDGGTKTVKIPPKQAPDVLTTVFEDNFDREMATAVPIPIAVGPLTVRDAGTRDASAVFPLEAGTRDAMTALLLDAGSDAARRDGSIPPLFVPETQTPAVADPLGPNWYQAKTTAWRLEKGRLCGQGAHNHGVWLTKPIPINARIEFEATTTSPEGDLKAEIWGDGKTFAKGVSYNDATSYLAILGGWKNTLHVLARKNEHASDRKEIRIDKDSDDPRQQPVSVSQPYKFKIERKDGKTVRWYVNDVEYLAWEDEDPLAGIGHDHFGFNNWEVKVCYDNVKVTPL